MNFRFPWIFAEIFALIALFISAYISLTYSIAGFHGWPPSKCASCSETMALAFSQLGNAAPMVPISGVIYCLFAFFLGNRKAWFVSPFLIVGLIFHFSLVALTTLWLQRPCAICIVYHTTIIASAFLFLLKASIETKKPHLLATWGTSILGAFLLIGTALTFFVRNPTEERQLIVSRMEKASKSLVDPSYEGITIFTLADCGACELQKKLLEKYEKSMSRPKEVRVVECRGTTDIPTYPATLLGDKIIYGVVDIGALAEIKTSN